jgi:diguanylate cyclase (GGDEF)-like protein
VAIEFAPSARVLLAEGNRFHVHLITRALHDSGYEVHAVGTQAEAEAAGPGNFDAVLVADQLEDGSGLELVRATASRPDAPPVVMLVDADEPPEPSLALAAGAVDQIVKEPGNLAAPLRIALGRALERARLLARIADLERRLEETTRLDPVSGVYTGRYFQLVLAREIARIRRFGGQMALLGLTGTNAEGIERTLGAHVRDRIMREVGTILQSDLRLTDLAGAWPDGRFLVALTGTDRPGAEVVSVRIGRKLAALEVSLGLAPGLMPRPELLAAGGADAVESAALEAGA